MKTFSSDNLEQLTTLLRVLTKKYGDEGVKKIITIAKTYKATLPTALQLESDNALLKMPNDLPNIFNHPRMMEWIKNEVTKFNEDYPEKTFACSAGLW